MFDNLLHELVLLLSAVAASSGIWALVAARNTKKSASEKMLLGLGHDRVIYLCKKYIAAGCISSDDFENLNDYLYEPYLSMGGNGTAKRYMEEVKKLPEVAPHTHVPHKPRGAGTKQGL